MADNTKKEYVKGVLYRVLKDEDISVSDICIDAIDMYMGDNNWMTVYCKHAATMWCRLSTGCTMTIYHRTRLPYEEM